MFSLNEIYNHEISMPFNSRSLVFSIVIVFPSSIENFCSMQENPKLYVVMNNNTTVLIGPVHYFFFNISGTNFVFKLGGSYDIIDVQVVLKGNKN